MLALALAFATHVPMPCPMAQAASHCPMHATTAPCCRLSGCFSSLSARHEVASLEAPAQNPMPPLVFSYVSSGGLADFAYTITPKTSPPHHVARSIEFHPLLI